MPKSKRAKVVTLTQTTKKTKANKETLFNTIREASETYPHVYIVAVENMRNAFLKEIQQELKGTCRFFFGRNKVMAKALGNTEETEHANGLRFVAEKLEGNVGLLFSSMKPDEVSR